MRLVKMRQNVARTVNLPCNKYNVIVYYEKTS